MNKLVKKSSKIDFNNCAISVAINLEEATSKSQQWEVRAKVKTISLGKVRRDRLHLFGTRMVRESQILTGRKTGGKSTLQSSSVLYYQMSLLLT